MSLRRARAIAYGVVALLGVAAVVFTSPLPRAASMPAAEVQSRGPSVDSRERFDTLGQRETLVSVLGRGGLSATAAREALNASKLLDHRRIRIGMPVRLSSSLEDSLPVEISLGLAVDRILHLRRTASGWTGEVEQLSWTTDTIVVSGVVRTHLYAAMDSAARDKLGPATRDELTRDLASLYEYRVDMSRDLQVGDSFTVVAEREVGRQGAVRIGRIVAATMKLSGTTIDAVRFKSAKVAGEFFDGSGKPLRSGFLRAPVEFRYISSGFGMRRHPILGTMRRHVGTDYAANSGTPIRAIGDGVVIKAGWGNGYGNMLEIRHANGFVSRYGHMRGFAQGVRAGKRVVVGDRIGYVGSTGLSTAPHLHFEVLVRGVQRNPRQALRNASSDPIPRGERRAFAVARTEAQAMLRSPAPVASADTSSARRGTQQQ